MAGVDKNNSPEATAMSIGQHLSELRNRLIICVLALAGAVAISWVFKDPLMRLLVRPHVMTMRKLGLPEALRFIRYQEKFYSYMKVSVVAAIFIALPIILYQMWYFISAGLYPTERRWVRLFGPMSGLLFVAGALFGFLVLIPTGLRFLITIGSGTFEPMITMGDYLKLFMLLTLMLGLVFELPLVMMFLVKIGVLDADAFIRGRRYAILGAFVVGAVLTPPDPFTQLMMALPMMGLYEVGIVAAHPSRRNLARLGVLVLCVAMVAGALYGYARWRATHVGEVVASVEGGVYAYPSSAEPVEALAGQAIATGARIITRNDGPLHFRLGKNAHVKLNRETEVLIASRRDLRLERGELWIKSTDTDSQVRLVTPDVELTMGEAEATVRAENPGTVVTVRVGEAVFRFERNEGRILAGRQKRFLIGGEKVEEDEGFEWLRQKEETIAH